MNLPDISIMNLVVLILAIPVLYGVIIWAIYEGIKWNKSRIAERKIFERNNRVKDG